MAQLFEINSYTKSLLRLDQFSDRSLNGLQFEGGTNVIKIGAAVDAGGSVIKETVNQNCDLLLVHHGIFWGTSFPITGGYKNIFETILNNKLSLFAAHLPLDAHEEYGNNFGIAEMLGLENATSSFSYNGQNIGCSAENTQNLDLENLVVRLCKSLEISKNSVLNLNFGPEVPRKVGIVSGGGSDGLMECVENGVDTFISGEPKQFAYHFAKDHGLNVIFAGHYATETVGVKKLAAHLADKFKIDWTFIDQPTGI